MTVRSSLDKVASTSAAKVKTNRSLRCMDTLDEYEEDITSRSGKTKDDTNMKLYDSQAEYLNTMQS